MHRALSLSKILYQLLSTGSTLKTGNSTDMTENFWLGCKALKQTKPSVLTYIFILFFFGSQLKSCILDLWRIHKRLVRVEDNATEPWGQSDQGFSFFRRSFWDMEYFLSHEPVSNREDSNHSTHPHSLIRVLIISLKKRIIGYPQSPNQRLRSDCANEQSDLYLPWAQMPTCTVKPV